MFTNIISYWLELYVYKVIQRQIELMKGEDEVLSLHAELDRLLTLVHEGEIVEGQTLVGRLMAQQGRAHGAEAWCRTGGVVLELVLGSSFQMTVLAGAPFDVEWNSR